MAQHKRARINYIDLAIVMVFLASCLFLAQLYFRLKNPPSNHAKWVKIEAVTFVFADYKIDEILKIGAVGYDYYDNPTMRIIRFIEKSADESERIKKWHITDKETRDLARPVFMEMELRLDKRGPFYYYGNQLFHIGATFYLRNDRYSNDIIVLKNI